MLDIIFLLIVGAVAGFIGAAAGGGGGFVSFFSLILLGIPPHIAIATNKLGDVGLHPTSIYNFNKAKKIKKNIMIPLILLGIAGAIVGSNILISIEQYIIKFVVIGLLTIVLITNLMKKNLGIKRRRKHFAWSPAYFLTGVYAGFFGSGSGIFSTMVLCGLRGLRFIEANANSLVSGMFGSIASVIIFSVAGMINYTFGIPLFIGNFIGGYLGSKTVIKKGNVWVKTFYTIIIVVTIVKLLFM
ncbi:MAG: sulfite exporter TauE/SafE family protein [Candidatus Aenigmarchaeota archaeon]|nr:sulfite exporter TauE/SafE family protein [Candidatus Aenigmarchaeota archaeon]